MTTRERDEFPLQQYELDLIHERRKRAGVEDDVPVAGGGCAGAFWGSLFVDPKKRGVEGERLGCERIDRVLADEHSAPNEWLRENGRYLTPNGGDTAVALSILLRNWVA